MLGLSTMVHRRYRNLEVFSHMVGMLHEATRAKGIRLILGFPNSQSLAPFKVLFGYGTLAESPLCTWSPKGRFPAPEVEPITGVERDDSEWGPPADDAYWNWRSRGAGLHRIRAGGTVELAYKGPEDGVLTVLDLAARPSPAARYALAGLASAAGASAIRLTERHARQAGIPLDELNSHENYTVRLTGFGLSAPEPKIRLSLLLSDVF
jgi:hypothetical protein